MHIEESEDFVLAGLSFADLGGDDDGLEEVLDEVVSAPGGAVKVTETAAVPEASRDKEKQMKVG